MGIFRPECGVSSKERVEGECVLRAEDELVHDIQLGTQGGAAMGSRGEAPDRGEGAKAPQKNTLLNQKQ